MKLLLLPGDGIGPEIVAATEAVLIALDRCFSLELELSREEIGLVGLARQGATITAEQVARAGAADGVVLGPVSTADYPDKAEGGLNPSAELRRGLDLYANLRPSRSRRGIAAVSADMDLLIVRENTEGFYADRTMHAGSGEFMPTPDLALAVRKISRGGSRRVVRAACEQARRRKGRLTVVHKANVLKLSDGLFREAALEAAADFPDLAVDEVLVDAMASLLVRTPAAFDVVVTTNMFGDILSNEAAELSGGLGLAPSLNAGEDHAVAQASHGSAPDLAGRDQANPVALVLSAAMLLDWIGRRQSRDAPVAAARALEAVVEAQLSTPAGCTVDLGGPLGTSAFAAALCERLA